MISLSKFKSLLPAQLLDKLAVEYNVNADNHVRLPGQTVFLCLLNGLLNHPVLTQRMLEEHYEKLTCRSCDHSSFGKRLGCIDFTYFKAVFEHLHNKLSSVATKADMQTLKLRIIDATTVTLSAKILGFGLKSSRGNQSHIKSVIELSDEGIPNLLHVCDDQSEFADVRALGDTMKTHTRKGDLWVFDKGCYAHHVLFDLHRSGSFWITPHLTQRLVVIETVHKTDSSPATPPEDEGSVLMVHKVELAVFSGRWSKVKDLESMKIIVIHCHRWDRRSKSWKPFVLMTNLPLSECGTKAGPYIFEEIADIYRRRWEIEVFFKLLKQHLSYDHLTSRSENGIKIMIYMSMIASLLMIWYKQQTRIDRGWKSVKFWLAEDARKWTSYSLKYMQLRASP